jgi:type I restriction-modification system DNA methylase subunit
VAEPCATYVIEQPLAGYGRGYQAVCRGCGVLAHLHDKDAATQAAVDHYPPESKSAFDPPLTPDQIADAAHEARKRQRAIEQALA